MNRRDRDRLQDVLEAGSAIAEHLQRGPLSDGLVFDAVRVRLIEIGEAVKAVSTDLLAQQPSIPWRQIAAMRDQLAHRYFETSHAIVARPWAPILSSCRSPPGRCWPHLTPRVDPGCGGCSPADSSRRQAATEY